MSITYFIKKILYFSIDFLDLISKSYGSFLSMFSKDIKNNILENLQKKIKYNSNIKQEILYQNIHGKNIRFKIFTPNLIVKSRVDSFKEKEPETLNWIDEFGGRGALLDIGANIGLFSIYYAISKTGNVYAFEPLPMNINELSKNININNLQNKINIIPNPILNKNTLGVYNLSSHESGSSFSNFQKNKIINKDLLYYKNLGLSVDFLIDNKIIPEYPSMIKIDIDGNEDLVMKGMIKTLKNPKCKTVLIELSNLYINKTNRNINFLLKLGFKPNQKINNDLINKKYFNKIFIK